MIYITGDIHGEVDIQKLSEENWNESKKLTSDDYLIICGDFGLPFLPTDVSNETALSNSQNALRESYRHWIKWLSERNYTILWIDGNHDNHSFWYHQPVTEWHGGKVNIHPHAANVIHLKRGEYYEIDGHTFWTMGGAESVDKASRTPSITWWETEIPSSEEMQNGLATLNAHKNKVDFIITHTMPSDLQFPVFHHFLSAEPTSIYFNEIYKNVDFKYWFCGHFHMDIDSKWYRIRVLYDDIVPIHDF